MHGTQTQATTAQSEAVSHRALAAMLLATDRTKEERRKLDDLFPQAKLPDARLAWKAIAKGVKKLHEQISSDCDKVGDDQGAVGDAYRKASRASHRDSGASAQLAAHVAIETIAKSFVTDGTYANFAVNPDGIQHIAALVGELQHQSRGLNRTLGLGGLAIDQVFFSNPPLAGLPAAEPQGSPSSPALAERIAAYWSNHGAYQAAVAAERSADTPEEKERLEAATQVLLDASTQCVRDVVNVRTTAPADMIRKYEIIQRDLYNRTPEAAAKDTVGEVTDEHCYDAETLMDGIMADIYALAQRPAPLASDAELIATAAEYIATRAERDIVGDAYYASPEGQTSKADVFEHPPFVLIYERERALEARLAGMRAHTPAGLKALATAARTSVFEPEEAEPYSSPLLALFDSCIQVAAAPTAGETASDRAEWDRVLKATRDAKAHYDALIAAYYGRVRDVRSSMPVELAKPSTHYGIAARWHSVEALNEDDMLSADEKVRLAPVLAAWKATEAATPVLDTDEIDNAAHDAWVELEFRLIELKAPDAAAEADRLEMIGHMNNYGPIDLTDEAGLMIEAQTFAGRCALNASFAILRQAGRPVLALEDFDARAWIKSYEGLGGVVSCGLWDYLILVTAPGSAEADAMRADLYTHPAWAEVVYNVAKDRVTTGGDKLYWSGWKLRDTMPSVPFDRVDTWRENGEWKVNVTTFDGHAGADPLSIAAE